MRLKRGTLDGYRDNRRHWIVVLPRDQTLTQQDKSADLFKDQTERLLVQIVDLTSKVGDLTAENTKLEAILEERQRQIDQLSQLLTAAVGHPPTEGPDTILASIRRLVAGYVDRLTTTRKPP